MEKVLITGGAGYIGQNIVDKLVANDFHVIVVDVNENAEMMLLKKYGREKITVANTSIIDKCLFGDVFKKYTPDYVIHAAAHKHVSLVEANPKEAINNNIIGTINVFSLCIEYKVKKCLYISTDKADNPESVYGYTKKAGEVLIDSYKNLSNTEFMAVRFCNVLDAPGSVTQIFRNQLENNLPLTVTDFRMERYFITVSQAVDFVYKVLFKVGTTGHVYMLDIGKQTNIYELAKQLRAEAHKEDLPIIETGILPGERLTEPYSIGQQTCVLDNIYLVK